MCRGLKIKIHYSENDTESLIDLEENCHVDLSYAKIHFGVSACMWIWRIFHRLLAVRQIHSVRSVKVSERWGGRAGDVGYVCVKVGSHEPHAHDFSFLVCDRE